MRFRLLFIVFLCSFYSFSQKDSLQYKSAKEKRICFTVDYGFGLRTAKSPGGLSQETKNYIKDLRSGSSLDFKLGYKKDSNTVLGLMYSRYNSKGSLSNVSYVEPNGSEGTGDISDNITISFIRVGGGLYEKGFRKEDAVVFDMYLGYISYKNVSNLTNNYTFKGGNLGVSTSLSYYLGLSQSIKIGPSIAFSGGMLKKFDIVGDNGFRGTYKLEKDTYESLYRFDFMIGTLIKL